MSDLLPLKFNYNMQSIKLFSFTPVTRLVSLILLVLLAFSPIVFNGFVSWDDQVYIINNALIQTISWPNLQQIFVTSFEGHYHPLTLISLSIDYQLFGSNPLPFHLHNLVLHILNTILVWIIIRKITANALVSWLTAAFFGLHPMHVEAVAWATARKDVLYSIYFLLSILFYFNYKEKKNRYWYLLSVLAFILSVLSKGQAVFLPVCLVVLSYIKGERLLDLTNWKDKIIYFILAFAFGIIAYLAQKETGYMGESASMPVWWKVILTACLSFCMYLYKIILPISLSAYYPVPVSLLPALISLGVLVVIGVWGIKHLRNNRLILGGLLFFVVNIFVFLRWIPVSNYIIADRYTYISSIGLFLIAAHGVNSLKQRSGTAKLWMIIPLVMIVFYTASAYARTGIWKDSLTLVNDILIKYPDVYPALNTRGVERMDKGDLQGAMEDFNRALAVQPQHSRGWANRGTLLFKMGNKQEALQDLNQAVSLDPENPRLRNNRGLMYDALEKPDEALKDFNAAIAANVFFAEAYSNRGMVLARTGKPEEAIKDFNKALEINPVLQKTYANRGKAKNQTADFKGAIEDLEIAIKGGLSNPLVYFDLGFSWYNLKDFYKAKVYFDKALDISPDFVNALKYRGFTQFNEGDYLSAVNDLDRAVVLDTTDALLFGMRGLALIRLNRTNEACLDFARAESMGLVQVRKEIEKHCNK
ncbi:MAG: tetratricopeptide repeat protein [Bacteroidales bacterium]